MGIYGGFLPPVRKDGKCGYYPVMSSQDWDELPEVYKAIEWKPLKMRNRGFEESTVVKYVEFDVVWMEPYGINATVRVHRDDVMKILYCSYKSPQCLLYSISKVVFENGEEWGAKWMQDSTTGSYAIYAGGYQVATQGGYLGFVPNNIKRDDSGKFVHDWNARGALCTYQLSDPFRYVKEVAE